MNNDNPSVPSSNGLTPAEQADHDRSVHDYPNIKFSPTEYVVIDVQRSIWGLARIWAIALAIFGVMIAVTLMVNATAVSTNTSNFSVMIGLVIGTIVLPLAAGFVGTSIYRHNHLIVTNERVFAEIQNSPFSHRTQNIELEHIEDCSFNQNGIVATILNYGSIRLSTVGDEQTYLITFVDRPREQFRTINHVVQQVDEGEATRYRRDR